MKNLKHSIVACIAVAMISSLAVSQVKGTQNGSSAPVLLTSGGVKNVLNVPAQADTAESDGGAPVENEEVPFDTDEAVLSEHMIDEITEEKSDPQEEYVKLAYGTLAVREAPSEEAQVIDQIDAKTEVKIYESTEGWYKIAYGQGQTGYVPSEHMTEDKEEAEDAAMHYDHYNKARVATNSQPINVRSKADKDSSVITTLDKGTEVIVQVQQGDFIKVYYGSEYNEGYIAAEGLEIIDDSWIPKETVADKIEAIAEKKRQEEQERVREAVQRAEFAAASSSAKTANKKTEQSAVSTPASSNKGQALVNEAKKYLGVKYVWGGTSPSGFDCSGLVQYCARKLGISVSRTSSAQAGNGKAVSRSNLQPGDLVFFQRGGRVHHVGIYVGNGNMIHAPQTGDVVKISSIDTPYRQRSYAGARRITG